MIFIVIYSNWIISNMIQISTHIQTRYKSLLIEKAVHEKNHHLYLKWLRYYLDFCVKYKFNQSNKESLPEFLNKLREKNKQANSKNRHLMQYPYFMKPELNRPESIFQAAIKILSLQKDKMSQNQTFNALLFFFRHVIKKEFGEIKDIPRAKRKPYIPVVLSREEIDKIIKALSYPYDLIAKLLYGCGLRISECMNLRVQNFNFDAGILTIHDGKGKKDRTVPLPETIIPELKDHLEIVIQLHHEDLEWGYAGCFLFDSIDGKYKNAAGELVWQWFFPAKTLTFVPEKDEYRRYHLHDTHVQKAIKRAVRKAKIAKRASAHTFRHSFAGHLLQANYDIRTIQQLLGHSDVWTTMIYKQTIESHTIKEAKSPLDFS